MAVIDSPADDLDGPALAEGRLDGFVGPKVRLMWKTLNARMVNSIAPFGVRSGSYSTLALVSANPGCSQNQVARYMGMNKSAMVAILDELEDRRLLSRLRPAHDRRRHAL